MVMVKEIGVVVTAATVVLGRQVQTLPPELLAKVVMMLHLVLLLLVLLLLVLLLLPLLLLPLQVHLLLIQVLLVGLVWKTCLMPLEAVWVLHAKIETCRERQLL